MLQNISTFFPPTSILLANLCRISILFISRLKYSVWEGVNTYARQHSWDFHSCPFKHFSFPETLGLVIVLHYISNMDSLAVIVTELFVRVMKLWSDMLQGTILADVILLLVALLIYNLSSPAALILPCHTCPSVLN